MTDEQKSELTKIAAGLLWSKELSVLYTKAETQRTIADRVVWRELDRITEINKARAVAISRLIDRDSD